MSSNKPLIYAELLSNIRQISVLVALDAPCGPGTKAELSADGQKFILQHEGDTTILNLPGQAVSNFLLQKPTFGDKELSWRIPVAGQATRDSIENAQSNEAPWSAKELSAGAEFACRNCGTIIVEKGTIKEWRDLPSENWAEMMEFWHCHKPDVPPEESNRSSEHAGHVHPDDAAASKGYGATSKFTARTGIGFIDLTTFLLQSTDCSNLKLNETTDDRPSLASCFHCHNNFGYDDPNSSGIRFYKWSLSLISSQHHHTANPSLSSIVSARCLSSIQASCVSKLVLESRRSSSLQTPMESRSLFASLHTSNSSDSSNPTVSSESRHQSKDPSSASSFSLLWVFSSSLFYSTTRFVDTEILSSPAPTPPSPSRAMKVFWRLLSVEEAKKLLDSETADELLLPEDVFVEIGRVLEDSALSLPPSARTFKEWQVGLLDRYQPGNNTT